MSNDIIVEVLDGQPTDKSGTFKNDDGEQQDYTVRTQDAKLECGGFAYPYQVRLEKDQAGYAPGRYRLAIEKMFEVTKGKHYLSKFTKLQPLTAASK